MLKIIQEREDGEKLVQLIPKMREGGCDAAETWFVQECLRVRRGLTEEVMRMLHQVPEEGGSSRDAWLRGAMARWGVAQERDDRRAAEILKPHEQDPQCAALLGPLYLWSPVVKDLPRALELLERSSEAGCAEGIYCLSMAYEDGRGVPQDEAWAYELVCRAAYMSHPVAMDTKAFYLVEGVGVERNEQLVARYYEKAGFFGCTQAYLNLGICYRDGDGVEADGHRAASLFRKAIVMGDEDARESLDDLPAEDAIPWGEWCPDPLMHNYVPLEMHHQMRTVLLMRARRGSLLSQVPKDIVLQILFWICT